MGGGLVPSGLVVLRAVPRGLPVGALTLSSTVSGLSTGGPCLVARGSLSLVRTSSPGAVPSLFSLGALGSSATGPLLCVAGLGVAVFLLRVVVHLVVSRAFLATGGCLLVPLAGPGVTTGSPCLAF